jgi:hypothetical protein
MGKKRINRVLEEAFLKGLRLYGFRSGGGLRVLTLGKCDKGQRYYSEHPNVLDALEILCDDYLAGGRKYHDVYGKIHDHYLTGSTSPDSELDRWILRGNTIRAKRERGSIVVILKGYGEFHTPDDIHKAVLADGIPRECRNRGYIYTSSPMRFPNGKLGVSTSYKREDGKDAPSGADPWMWPAIKTGEGLAFFDAVEKALVADSVEVSRDWPEDES